MTAPADHEIAYAKINLALHVRRRRSDGFHDIESLFAFAQHGDRIAATVAERLTLTITGPFSQGLACDERNLVLRAAKALRTAFSVSQGAAIALDKNLPIASGIGGGSADAAAALRLLCRLWEIDVTAPQVGRIAESLGADVPACLASVTLRGDAKGDVIETVDGRALSGTPLLLVNPNKPLSTATVFSGWDGIDRGALTLGGDLLATAQSGRNDLTQAAVAQVPEVAVIIAQFDRCAGITLARMSGSGATCFGLFGSVEARNAAQQRMQHVMPDAWIHASELR